MVGLAVFAALAALGTGSASTPTLPLPGPVSELAADGGRVAILLRTTTGDCARDRVAVWGPVGRTFVPIGASACTDSTSTGAGLEGVALARTTVAYVQFAGGNTRELRLRIATLSRPRPVTVASAAFGLDQGSGTFIGRIVGDKSLLAFDWWSMCAPCAGATPVAPRSAVWRVVPSGAACPGAGGLGELPRCRSIRETTGPLRLLAAGGGRVAMTAGDQGVEVRATDGTPLYAGVLPGAMRAARLDGGVLVVLTRSGNQNSLWVVDTNIADGTAAERFDAEFTDVGTHVPDDVPREVLEQIARRTPGFSGWQQEHWLYHCGDGAAFEGVDDDADAEGATYRFRCRHCGESLAYSEST